MHKENCSITLKITKTQLENVHLQYLKLGLSIEELQGLLFLKEENVASKAKSKRIVIFILVATLLTFFSFYINIITFILGIRCVIPNNYFIWEATRPVSNCSFCSNVTKPVVLHNVTRKSFESYTYLSQPIVVKGAFLHWPAMNKFTWEFFKELYSEIEDSYRSVDEECQFLHFKSDFMSIKDVFAMSNSRVRNLEGEKSWYVGWGNCHPTVLEKMRNYYPKPHFLPQDSEIPHKEYVFMGYDDGATMHLDFINRLMWQAQLQGSKIWNLLPPPECQNICNSVQFTVQPGDGVLVDTRVWYHSTMIPNGQFSLSVQSEYG